MVRALDRVRVSYRDRDWDRVRAIDRVRVSNRDRGWDRDRVTYQYKDKKSKNTKRLFFRTKISIKIV